MGVDRGDVDDGSCAEALEVGQEEAGDFPGGQDVDLPGGVHFLWWLGIECASARVHGVVDPAVDSAETSGQIGEGLLDGSIVGDVGMEGNDCGEIGYKAIQVFLVSIDC